MRTTRIFLDQPLLTGDVSKLVDVTGDRAHYIRSVLRLKTGASLIIFNGEGGEFVGKITHLSKARIGIQLSEYRPLERALDKPITIGLCITKRDAMDIAVQKVTELGAANIQPLISDRVSVAQKQIQSRQTHWRNITISACEQCGRNTLPRIHPLAPLASWYNSALPPLRLVLHHREQTGPEAEELDFEALTPLVSPLPNRRDTE